MSASAQRFAYTERDRKKTKRARPRRHVITHVIMFHNNRETQWRTIELRFAITKQRVRSARFCKTNVNKDPGEDGARWRCTCKLQACGHVAAVLAAGQNIREGLPPVYPHDIGRLYLTLTKLGEELLRWRWAAQALREPP